MAGKPYVLLQTVITIDPFKPDMQKLIHYVLSTKKHIHSLFKYLMNTYNVLITV